jgi:hypothetical protein
MNIIKSIRGLYLPSQPKYIRKWSVISHWFLGALCAYLTTVDRPFAISVLAIFAGMEVWNDYNEGKGWKNGSGCTDFWDAFIVFIGGIVLVSILSELHIAG